MNASMQRFINNAMGSWITSLGGAVLGLPEVWAGLQPLFDNDAATGADWGTVMRGAIIFLAFLASRDGNKSSEDVKVATK